MLIQILTMTHNITTLLFGIFISAFLLGIKQNRKNVKTLSLFFCADGLLFIGLYMLLGDVFTDNIFEIYPFITHLPLVFLLHLYYKKTIISSCISVFSAYLCCQISNWGGLFALYITGSECFYYTVRILITVAVFILLCKYVCHTTASLFEKNARELCMIGFLPFIYYIFDYAFTKFSDQLYSENPVVIEFYGFAFCIAYLIFLFVYFREYEQKKEVDQYNTLMAIQLTSIHNEAEQVKKNEQLLSIYRHDMRHHMSVLHTLIQNGSTDEAMNYIRENTESYNNTAITRYCRNDMINSVVSVYKIRFADKDLHLNCDIKINDIGFSETEFCAILSNALENSMHAIEGLSENKHWAKLSMSNKGNSVLLQLENPTDRKPIFVDGVPVSKKKGHGIGIKSIIYYVDKLNGQWQFTVNDGKFIMQVII